MYKIFIVEDDAAIAGALCRTLERWDYSCKAAENFRAITAEFAAFSPHLVLMDISLPFYDGYHWCREIRNLSDLPILFLSSADSDMNIVMAMNMGADDFLKKPVAPEVLAAKVHALLRRAYDFGSQKGLILARGELILDLSSGKAQIGEKSEELTKNEQRILQILLENAGGVVPREQIMDALWQSDLYIDDNTLTVNITRLRKKLAALGAEEVIGTKKGVGYFVL